MTKTWFRTSSATILFILFYTYNYTWIAVQHLRADAKYLVNFQEHHNLQDGCVLMTFSAVAMRLLAFFEFFLIGQYIPLCRTSFCAWKWDSRTAIMEFRLREKQWGDDIWRWGYHLVISKLLMMIGHTTLPRTHVKSVLAKGIMAYCAFVGGVFYSLPHIYVTSSLACSGVRVKSINFCLLHFLDRLFPGGRGRFNCTYITDTAGMQSIL